MNAHYHYYFNKTDKNVIKLHCFTDKNVIIREKEVTFMNTKYAISEYVLAEDIKRLRDNLNMTQKEFALFINT